MKKLLFCFIAFCPVNTFAQSCDCLVNFDYTTSHVADSYSGYTDKVKSKNLKEFNSFTERLRKRAANATGTDSCYVILKTWINYFKDQHLRVQLDWRYRKKYPEQVKRLNKLFANKPAIPAPDEKLGNQTVIKQLNANTILLRLPSFEWNEKKIIDSLFKANYKNFKKIPNWIIDVRDNGGGTDYAFSSLLPYIYANPVHIKPDEYRSSKNNIAVLESNLKDPDVSEDAKGFLNNLINLMKLHPNQFVNPSGKESFEIKLDSVYSFPQKVAILIDRNSASSTESFLLIAMQSKKVKVYGENSTGMLDYGSYQYFDIPCPDFNLVIPIARSKRLPQHPIDNIGVTPNVKIKTTEKDKIGFIQKKLEQ
ncbi:hypothetical protein EWM62_14555 [Mucilaginibacter terrigena]|uniref:Tail specific protease domain-containing protein n=1 Tax=Mucilaginibacter terrigena TaxID=2492395 RepID=A0A4Q5LN15_9SPHI|nr:S41 family peptidase [Mucilaginibacter terrigena]RYU89536.1 hypothetical protein EWM62_14555 [Mucilaginibacter terrigena]